MNKQETVIVVLLFCLLLGWFHFVQRPQAQHRAAAAQAAAMAEATQPVATATEPAAVAGTGGSARAETALRGTPPETVDTPPRGEEHRVRITNDVLDITLTSWGGAVASVNTMKYPASPEKDSPALTLDFADRPSLSLHGVPGLSTNEDFTVRLDDTGRTAVAERTSRDGVAFRRTVTLGDGYTLKVVDVFSNACREAKAVPAHDLFLGPMRDRDRDTSGIQTLGADTLAAEGEGRVSHWGGDLMSAFGVSGGCSQPDPRGVSPVAELNTGGAARWFCVKSKFFAQILAPDGNVTNVHVSVARDLDDLKAVTLKSVSAAGSVPGFVLAPDAVSIRAMDYYVGPKMHSILRHAGPHWERVMEFGPLEFFRWICGGLLWLLNALHNLMPNYGVAVMVLTLIVRIVFWPVTHKSTESMKKMQKLQPEMQAIRQKFRDNPQKMNQEVMALYQRHGVNPLAGCLPILVQIPIFIALFTVLRSAVELRYASFLWIHDLSAPERLIAFKSALPLVGWDALNILPFLMTATMVWQQKLTPTTGDPQQQNIMLAMSVMMLFFLYNMPSGLCLYWTTSQCVSIVQLYWQRRDVKPAVRPAK